MKGDDRAWAGDDGNLLPARGVFFDANPDGTGDGQNLIAVFLELGPRGVRQDVFLREHGDFEERADNMHNLRVGDAEDLHPDHPRPAGKAPDGVQISEFLHGPVGFVVADDPEFARSARLERGRGGELPRGATNFGLLVGRLAG